jgi:hypothetical protein
MFLQKNCKQLIAISVCLIFCVLTCVLSFASSEYYNFINRPKVLQSGKSIIALILICTTLLTVQFVLNVAKKPSKVAKKLKKAKIVCKNKKPCKITKRISKTCAFKVLRFQKKFSKKSITKNAKKEKFATLPVLHISFYALIIALCLCFDLKLLWLCVGLTFACLMLNFAIIAKSKNFHSKLCGIVCLMCSICLNLSFYFIYLLN